MAIDAQVAEIEAEASKAIAAASDGAGLEAIRVAELGKKGRLSLLMRELGGMAPEQRQVAGPALNGLKDRLSASIAARSFKCSTTLRSKPAPRSKADARWSVHPAGGSILPMAAKAHVSIS